MGKHARQTGTCVTHEAVVRPAPPRRLSARILAATRNTCRPFGLRGGGCEGRFQQFLCELTGAELFCPPPEEGKGFCNGQLHKAEVLDLGLKEDGSNYWCHEYESVPGSTCENSFVHYDLQTVYNFVHFYQPCGRTKDGRCAVAEVFAEATDERFVVGAVCKEECLTSGDAPCK